LVPGGLNLTETYAAEVMRANRTGAKQAITNAGGGGAVFTKPVETIGQKPIGRLRGLCGEFRLATSTFPAAPPPARGSSQASTRTRLWSPWAKLRPDKHRALDRAKRGR
jgi:hypothetical protein